MTELDALKKKIRERLNDYADDLAGGAARDFADYKHLTGIIFGLAVVERDIIDLQKRVSEEE